MAPPESPEIGPEPDGEIWVASGPPGAVYSSRDRGATFEARGLRSPTITWNSIKVAPSNAQRIYATGYEYAAPSGSGTGPAGYVVRSDDDGATWRVLST